MAKTRYNLPCNIAQSLNRVGDRWTLLILHAILAGARTYKELQEALPGIPTNLLSDRLRALTADGLLTAERYSAHPPRVRYEPTDATRDLADVFNAFVSWGDAHLPRSYKCLTHAGHPVRLAYVDEVTGELLTHHDIDVIPTGTGSNGII